MIEMETQSSRDEKVATRYGKQTATQASCGEKARRNIKAKPERRPGSFVVDVTRGRGAERLIGRTRPSL